MHDACRIAAPVGSNKKRYPIQCTVQDVSYKLWQSMKTLRRIGVGNASTVVFETRRQDSLLTAHMHFTLRLLHLVSVLVT
jgi:hypothetical protein